MEAMNFDIPMMFLREYAALSCSFNSNCNRNNVVL